MRKSYDLVLGAVRVNGTVGGTGGGEEVEWMDHERTHLRWPAPWETSPRRLFSKILSGPLILLVTILFCSATAYAAEVHEERAPPGQVAIDGIQILKDVKGAQNVLREDAKPGVQCTHHPEHTEECGYIPAVESVPCAHQHDEACGYIEPQEGTTCTHTHDALCGYADAVPEVPCDKGCAPDEAGIIIHAPDCAYTPAVAEVPCGHIHDGSCGYAEPVAGSPCGHIHDEVCGFVEGQAEVPCGFVCDICAKETPPESDPAPGQEEAPQPPEDPELPSEPEPNPPAEVLRWAWVDEDGMLVYSEETGTWGFGVPGASVEQRLTAEILQEFLPKEITATLAESVQQAIALTWDLSVIPEEGAYEGSLILKAALPEGYTLSETAPELEVFVELGGGEVFDTVNKYVNWWRFVSIDGSLMPRISDIKNSEGGETVPSIEIEKTLIDIDKKSIDELKKLLVETVLPSKILCWGTTSDGKLEKTGFIVDSSIDEKKMEVTSSGLKVYSGTAYQWGRVDIEWDLPNEIKTEQKYTVYAHIEPKDVNGDIYQVIVNSNNQLDFNAGKGDSTKNNQILAITITLHNSALSDHIVQSVEPDNVTVNLFDYWVEDYGEVPIPRDPSKEVSRGNPEGDILQKSDWHYHEGSSERAAYSKIEDWYKGINEGKLLMFGDGVIHAGLWNKGAGENSEYGNKYAGMEGIVRPILENGFPLVNTDMADKLMMGIEDAENENYRDHTLIKDYLLAGVHTENDVYTTDGKPIPENGEEIQNLGTAIMERWDKDESLAYLFDPTVKHNYKTIYQNIKGLFQLDEKGYYYYNMRQNFAEFQERQSTDSRDLASDGEFILYDAGATTRTDGDKSIGNFFPFNKGSEVFTGVDENGKLTSNVDCARNSMNHHLGMTVEVDFRQPVNGRITNVGDNPMTFGFSGDDDVWVFIDDVLVLDLGGTHSEIYGTIDFSTGDVFIGRAFGVDGVPEDPDDEEIMVTQTNLKSLFSAAGVEEDSTFWRENTFSDNSLHTLKMFYLERGNYDSSIALRFNLQPPLYQQIKKVDQNGAAIAGVKFELYRAVKDGNEESYTPTDKAPIATLETDESGIARFINPNAEGAGDTPFDFYHANSQYYILKEVKTPEGYRPIPVDIILEYHPIEAMLTVVNRWTTGAYSSFAAYVDGNSGLTYGQLNNDGTITNSDEIVSVDTKKDGLVVAMPMVKVDNIWKVLCGSNMTGFQAIVPESRTIEKWREAALGAFLYQCTSVDDAQWFMDWNNTTNRLEGTLLDFPGQASRYKLLSGDEADMRMEYVIIDPKVFELDGIKEKIQKLTEENNRLSDAAIRYKALQEYVKGLQADGKSLETAIKEAIAAINAVKVDNKTGVGMRFLDAEKFMRNYRSLIYIPNEQRELRVWKVDQNGKGIDGVKFGLYRDKECTDEVTEGITGEVEGRNGVLVLAPYVENSAGYAKVTWAKADTEARYYLKELTAPEGYELNETIIPVVVGTYSIYADAGEANDGVTVMGGVGKLAQTMVQFASNEDINITLRDITAFAQRQKSQSFTMTGWEDDKLSGTDVLRDMDLHYGMNSLTPRDYGLHKEDGGEMFYPFFITDTGFIRARVQQNYPALSSGIFDGAQNNNASKEDLGDTDITTLFSLLNVVVVTDSNDPGTQAGQLTVGKMVNKEDESEKWVDAIEYTKLYEFEITLTDSEGKPLPDEYLYFYGEDKSGKIKSGEKLLLHHDESVTILGLPVGTKCTVKEVNPQENWPIDPGPVIEGIITKDETLNALFVNNQSPSTNTGLLTISKTVSGALKPGDDALSFTFLLNLKDATGKVLEGTYSYHINDKENIDKIGDNSTFSLHHNESITIYGLPAGTKFTVTETAVEGWKTPEAASGDIAKGTTTEVEFVNIRTDFPPDTPDIPDNPGGSDPGPKPDKPPVTPPLEEPPEQPENPEEPPVTPVEPSDPGSPGTPGGPSDPSDPDEPVFIVGDPEVPFFGWNLPDEPVPTFGPPPDEPRVPPERRSDVPLTGESGRQDLALLLGSLLGLGVLYVENRKKKRV